MIVRKGCLRSVSVFAVVLAMAGGGGCLWSASARAADSSSKTAPPAEEGNKAWSPAYGPYNPYYPYNGGWWNNQNQQQEPAQEEKPKQIFQYDSKYRAAFEHPDFRSYGPQGDTRFAHGSTDPVTSLSGRVEKMAGGGNAAMPSQGFGGPAGLFPESVQVPQSLDVLLLPGQSDPGKTVTLRLRAPLEYSGGCWTVGPLEYDRETSGNRIIISVKGFRVNPSARPGQACGGARHAVADISLARSEVSKIKNIRFKLGTRSDDYEIRLEKDAVVLSPVSMTFFKPFSKGGEGDSLRQAFISGGLIALFVPATRAGEDLTDLVEDFGQDHGLVPYGAAGAEDLPASMYGNRVYYFFDAGKRMSAKLDRSTPKSVGSVLRKRAVREIPGSPGGVAERLDVYAALP